MIPTAESTARDVAAAYSDACSGSGRRVRRVRPAGHRVGSAVPAPHVAAPARPGAHRVHRLCGALCARRRAHPLGQRRPVARRHDGRHEPRAQGHPPRPPAPSTVGRRVPPHPPNHQRLIMKLVVIGGTGLIGSKLVTTLREHGHDAIAASPDTGVNTLTGEGLAEALQARRSSSSTSRTPRRSRTRPCSSSSPPRRATSSTPKPQPVSDITSRCRSSGPSAYPTAATSERRWRRRR